MKHSTGLTYKPTIQSSVGRLMERGALVHMFEFYVRPSRLKVSPDNLLNLANAISGNCTGSFSDFRGEFFFDDETKRLKALPCSAVRAGYPLQVFVEYSNVGLLIDPKKTDLLLIQTQDCHSRAISEKQMQVMDRDIFSNERLRKANFEGTDFNEDMSDIAYIPFRRTEEKYQEMQNIFKWKFWHLYSGGHAPGEEGFKKNIQRALDKSEFKHDEIMMTEILANVPGDAIKGLVIYSNSKNCNIDYGKSARHHRHDETQPYIMDGVLLANMFREKIAAERKLDLPVLHYHSHMDNTSFKDSSALNAPLIREVNIENNKIALALRTNPKAREIYEHYLGKDRVQDIILGKVKIDRSGKS